MSDHPLENFRATDEHHGGERSVGFDGDVLSVRFYRAERDNYAFAAEERHFRLVEVKQTWTEVES